MTVDDAEDLLVHGLEDIYSAETELVDALEDLAAESENEEITEAFETHLEETRTHVDRLEEIFDEVGISPDGVECEGIEGLIEEHEEFVAADPDQSVLDVHNVAAAEKVEHYEIAAYGNLAFLADELGMDEVADRLGETLDEEQATLEKLKDLTESYDYEQITA